MGPPGALGTMLFLPTFVLTLPLWCNTVACPPLSLQAVIDAAPVRGNVRVSLRIACLRRRVAVVLTWRRAAMRRRRRGFGQTHSPRLWAGSSSTRCCL
jgi:hypothetical protein